MPSFFPAGNGSGMTMPLYSGNFWSGVQPPKALFLKWSFNASGSCYISYSGGMTTTSGGSWFSGTLGRLDGYQMAPGDEKIIPPHILARTSGGTVGVYVSCDAAASGQGRLFWEGHTW